MTMVAPPGLKGLVVADTRIGGVRGTEGTFHYRGYDAPTLARRHSFETVWNLVMSGTLEDDATAFRRRIGSVRAESRASVIPDTPPLAALQAALPVALGSRPSLDMSEHQRQEEALRAAAILPTLVAAQHRNRHAEPAIPPDPSLSHAEDYLRMMHGKDPRPEIARALEQYLNLTVDHGMNASTFAARVVVSTGASFGAALSTAVGALSGPLHGGAPHRALAMVREIGNPDRSEAYVKAQLGRGKRVMGFGHAVYRTEDPRSTALRGIAQSIGGEFVDRAVATEARIQDALRKHKPNAHLTTNVEYYAGVVLHLCGIPPELFTPTFAVSRAVGWTAHCLEQAQLQQIMRPSSRYVGIAAYSR